MENRWFHQIGAGHLCDSLDDFAEQVLAPLFDQQQPPHHKTPISKNDSEILAAGLTLILWVFIMLSAKYTNLIREEQIKAYYIDSVKRWSEVLEKYMLCWTVLRKAIDRLQLSREAFNTNVCLNLQNHLEEKKFASETCEYQNIIMAPSILQTVFKLEKLSEIHDKVTPRIQKISGYINNKYMENEDSDDSSLGEEIEYLPIEWPEVQEEPLKTDYAKALNYFLQKRGCKERIRAPESSHHQEGDGRSKLTSEELVAIVNRYLMSIGEMPLSFQDMMLFVSILYDNVTMQTDPNASDSASSLGYEEICDGNYLS